MKTTQLSSRANVKQTTGADLPMNPAQIVTYRYTGVSSGSQTVINLGFAVDQANKSNFLLIIDGSVLTEGASNDYQFTSVQSNNTSSQVTMNWTIQDNLNITALYLGVAQPLQAATSISTVQAIANTANSNSMKNVLINSAFDVWQRGTSTTIANAATAYQADRWHAKNSLGTNGVLTFSRQTGILAGSKYGAQVQITTAPTAAQTNGCELYQVLENMDSLQFYGQVASFGINIKALGNVNQIGIQFCYAATEVKPTSFIGSEVLVSVNTTGFTLGQIINQAIGTAQTTSGVIGVRIRITGVTTGNMYDLNNGFIVEQAMMNVGSVLGNFSRAGKNIQDELSICQRYYEKGYDMNTFAGAATGSFACATKRSVVNTYFLSASDVPFRVNKLKNPTVTIYNANTGASGSGAEFNSSSTFVASRSLAVTVDAAKFVLSGVSGDFVAGNSMCFDWTADADI